MSVGWYKFHWTSRQTFIHSNNAVIRKTAVATLVLLFALLTSTVVVRYLEASAATLRHLSAVIALNDNRIDETDHQAGDSMVVNHVRRENSVDSRRLVTVIQSEDFLQPNDEKKSSGSSGGGDAVSGNTVGSADGVTGNVTSSSQANCCQWPSTYERFMETHV